MCSSDLSDVGGLLTEMGSLGLEIFSKTDKAAALVTKIRFYADDVVNKVGKAKELAEALGQGFSSYDATKAILDGVSKESAMTVLQGVGEMVVVAGTIAGAAVAAGAAAPSLATIAAVGAVVNAGIVGVKIGSKLNGMMEIGRAHV